MTGESPDDNKDLILLNKNGRYNKNIGTFEKIQPVRRPSLFSQRRLGGNFREKSIFGPGKVFQVAKSPVL